MTTSTIGFLRSVTGQEYPDGSGAAILCGRIDALKKADTSVSVSLDGESGVILSFPSSYKELNEQKDRFDALLNSGPPVHVTRLGGDKLMIDVFLKNGGEDDEN